MDLLAWLCGNIRVLAGTLGTPLFVPTSRNLGKVSNKVCVCWDVRMKPLRIWSSMLVQDLLLSLLSLGLTLGLVLDVMGLDTLQDLVLPSLSKIA